MVFSAATVKAIGKIQCSLFMIPHVLVFNREFPIAIHIRSPGWRFYGVVMSCHENPVTSRAGCDSPQNTCECSMLLACNKPIAAEMGVPGRKSEQECVHEGNPPRRITGLAASAPAPGICSVRTRDVGSQ